MLQPLIDDATNKRTLMESRSLSSVKLKGALLREAEAYVIAHPDHTAYQMLFALRSQAPETYKNLPNDVRAAVLCDALVHLAWLNDWGYLTPSESYDGKAAKALLETGVDALPYLKPLLSNRDEAPLMGGEEATMSFQYKYRRGDFAYRYVTLLLKAEPTFDPSPEVRDSDLDALAQKLGADAP